MKDEDSLWTLERAVTISKMESQSVSITTSTSIWPKNTGRKKKRKLRNVSKYNKEGHIVKDCKGK